MVISNFFLKFLSLLLFISIVNHSANAQQRIALVIGNGAYKHTTSLTNPPNDAKLFAKTLERIGFKVTLQTNADQQTMKRALRDFISALDRSGPETVGLVYYAGHGVQVDGLNFLIPVDAQIERESDVAIETVNASDLLDGMRRARSKLNIVILDACRNNPFRGFSRGAMRGLARLNAPRGSYVVFATAPGDVATDGSGNNSPFTAALSNHLATPGLTFEDVVKRVGREVSAITQDRQRPWLSSSVYQDFYPAGPGRATTQSEPVKAPQVAIRQNTPQRTRGPLHPGDTFRDCAECPELVVIPAGRFEMGSHNKKHTHKNQQPRHAVTIGKPIAVSTFEITFDEWEACVKAQGCAGYEPRDEDWGKGRQPVIRVNWEDASTYVAWLQHKTGKQYRLLSEAEWEYAARAGMTTMFHTGDTITTYDANFNARRSFNNGPKGNYAAKPFQVGHFKPNAFGLHDMHGNLSEWTQDCWHKSYDGAPTDGSSWTSPERGDTCNRRVIRGGSWFREAQDVRSASRNSMAPHIRSHEIGFRIARDLGE
ncbi:MAG: SUMF1/EgtB/PvdO family nonheme iron enzyme [Hyphomicrobiaceae bacterium]|nr:SUMF1/EgtB/PvdO family nonheme iron enzyme [Hyphomicrobiaceae bacterium]MCC0010941.1 SUMF1/EgtB/PvdO family nonheme iron enzyme [Hyphomicrobiaceae bacterium]